MGKKCLDIWIWNKVLFSTESTEKLFGQIRQFCKHINVKYINGLHRACIHDLFLFTTVRDLEEKKSCTNTRVAIKCWPSYCRCWGRCEPGTRTRRPRRGSPHSWTSSPAWDSWTGRQTSKVGLLHLSFKENHVPVAYQGEQERYRIRRIYGDAIRPPSAQCTCNPRACTDNNLIHASRPQSRPFQHRIRAKGPYWEFCQFCREIPRLGFFFHRNFGLDTHCWAPPMVVLGTK
jgi:hypothetical protein